MTDPKLVSLTEALPLPSGPDGWTVTPSPEELIVYIARVSNPSNQLNLETSAKLLGYCIEHKHWSPFEMVDMCVEIETSRAIAAQILRHRSFNFQEFSQRYAKVGADAFVTYPARRQAEKNRQASVDDLDVPTKEWFVEQQQRIYDQAYEVYEEALRAGVAKECARFVLPLNTKTRLYMKGSVRSWIHYLQVRTAADVQPEHRDIALGIQKIFVKNFPAIATALGWGL
jgi:thymidylate synthase (FAD)